MGYNWTEYWRRKNEFDTSMDVNFKYFLHRLPRHVKLDKTSRVLDIGSGPGHLEDAIHSVVKEIHGVDISERYNADAREKHKEHQNVFFHDLSPVNYLNFPMFDGKKFDVIIVMSVLQYYSNKEEVIHLLKNLVTLSALNAKILLCDLIVQPSAFKEIVEILIEYFKAGKILYALSLFARLRFSKYYQVRKTNGLLVLSEQEWKEIFVQLNLKAEFLKENLTLHSRRKNVLIHM